MRLVRESCKRTRIKRVIGWIFACCMFLSVFVSVSAGGPEGAQVVNGQVSFQQSGLNTVISASDRAIINYSSFDIARPEVVQFIQPGSNASVLNRILSANPTNINGTLLANGNVFFVNPAGVYIGKGAQISVNQLVASGLNISNSDFINGRYNFVGGAGSVLNQGDITAEKVYLIGRQVANSGSISCPGGYVVMAAGERVFIGEPGSEVVVEVEAADAAGPEGPGDSGTGVLNEGSVSVDGGRIVLAAGDIYSQAISNVGSLSASVGVGAAGQIRLTAPEGTIVSSGSIEATSASGAGGTVEVLGDKVGLLAGTGIDVSGSGGGGEVLVGGDYQGGGQVPAASRTYVSEEATIKADAVENGDGGRVIVWSDEVTRFYGDISARGGSEGGDGGFVEVSGKDNLGFYGYVDTQAPKGDNGTLLLDPTDLTITDTAGGENLDAGFTGTIEFGDGLNDGTDSVSAGVLEALAAATDLILKATNKITIDPLTSGGKGGVDKELTLDQTGSVEFLTGAGGFSMAAGNKINVTGSANLTIDAIAATSGGTGDGPVALGEVQTTSGNITVRGTTITLNGDLASTTGAVGGSADAVNIQSDAAQIQDAITIASSAATIGVSAGSFAENLTIDKSLTLEGAQVGTATAGSGRNYMDDTTESIITGEHTVTSGGVIMDGFTFSDPAAAVIDELVQLDSSGGGIDGVTLRNNFYTLRSGDIGVDLGTYSASNQPIANVIVEDSGFIGPADKASNPLRIGSSFANPEYDVAVSGLAFQRNTVDRGSIPVLLQGENLTGISIAQNTFTNTDGTVYVWGSQTTAPTGELSSFGYSQNNVDASNTYGIGIGVGDAGGSVFGDGNLDDTTIGINNNRFGIVPGGYGIGAVSVLSPGFTGTIDATANWWGDATGPQHGDNPHASPLGAPASGNLNIKPWNATATVTPATQNVEVDHPGGSIITVSDTIQGGIDAAIDGGGDIVEVVTAGTYDENVQVNKSAITLRTDSAISATMTAAAGVVVELDGGADGFTLGGAENEGFTLESGAGTTRLVQLSNGPQDVEISWNTLDTTGAAIYGVWVDSAGATGLDIHENTFVAGTIGDGSILGAGLSDLSVIGNNFTGPAVKPALGYAMRLSGVTGTSVIEDNTIDDYFTGIVLGNGTGTSGLDIRGNQISTSRTGINLLEDNGGAGLEMTGVNLENNTLTSNNTGVLIEDGSNIRAGQFTITGNQFNINIVGLESRHDSESAQVHGNSFSGNTNYGAANAGLLAALDAEANWWGDASGPTHASNNGGTGDAVSDKVDYNPWWGGNYVGDSHATAWEWRGNLHMDAGDSIQNAIDWASAAVADSIVMTAGTYTGAVNVDRQVSGILFAGDGSVASEIDGVLTLSDDTTANTGVAIDTQNNGALTLNSVSDTGVHSLTVDAGTGTITLDENVTVGNNLQLKSDTDVAAGRTLQAGANLGVDDGEKLTGNGTLLVEATAGTATLGGEVETLAGNLDVTAGTLIHAKQNMTAKDAMLLHGPTTVDAGKKLLAGTDLTVDDGDKLTGNGTLLVEATAGTATFGGEVETLAGNLDVTAGTLIHAKQNMTAKDAMLLHGPTTVDAGKKLLAGTDLTVDDGDKLTGSGTLLVEAT
ncbi:MAG: filamentous hemagglutinin N-terminal domain-containing protein, partial [Phycisphaerales bacterium]